jgi:transposase-like protein
MARAGKYDWEAIRAFYEAGHSARDCQLQFGISNGAWYAAVERGALVLRESSRRPRARTRDAVARLVDSGLSVADIARTLGVSKPTVCFHMRKLGIPARAEPRRRYDWDEVRRYYEAGHSARACRQRFGFGHDAWSDAVKRGAIEVRAKVEPIEDVLAVGRRRSRYHLKLRLLDTGLKQARCEVCGLVEWLGRALSLELHHINGNGLDNRLENLALLCPNCHSQTATWGGRNKRVPTIRGSKNR